MKERSGDNATGTGGDAVDPGATDAYATGEDDRAGAAGPTSPGQPGAGARYFVTVIAPGRDALAALRQHDLDLFKPTARAESAGAGADTFRVDGLLTLEEIGRLVSAGYRVLVQEDAAQKARGQLAPRATARGGAIGFTEWLAGMGEKPGRRG